MELKTLLERCPLIAILRGVRPAEVESIGAALEEAGVSIIEVPLNSPQPLESISILARRLGDRILVGAGTLTRVSQVAEVAGAGGRLIVTPHADTEIVRAAKAAGSIAVPEVASGTVPLASAVRIGAAMLLVVCRLLSRLRIGFSSGRAAVVSLLSAAAVTLGSGLWVNRSGCEKSTGDNSPGAITTRAPIRVQPYMRTAKFIGMRMQPCEAG